MYIVAILLLIYYYSHHYDYHELINDNDW